MRTFIAYFTGKPKALFLTDSIGAFISALFLFVIVQKFNQYFRMPEIETTHLSVIAVFFCIYSSACFLFIKNNWRPFVALIGIANIIYCALTIQLVIKYYHSLTIMGTTYFIIEIAIICALCYVELNVATRNK